MSLSYRVNSALTHLALFVLIIGVFTPWPVLKYFPFIIIVPSVYFTYLFFRERGWNGLYYLNPSQWCLMGLFGLLIMSMIVHFESGRNLNYIYQEMKYLPICFLSVFAFREVFKDGEKGRVLINFALVCCSLGTLYGLLAMWLGYYPIENIKVLAGNRNNGPDNYLMVYSPILAHFMVIITGMFIYRKKIGNYVGVKWIVLHWVINFVGLFYTYTRGAWLAFLFAIPFFFVGKGKKYFLKAVAGSVVVLCVGILVSPTAKRRFFNSNGSNNQRIALMKAGVEAIKEKPLLGWGYQNFKKNSIELMKKYGIDYPWQNKMPVHNNLMEYTIAFGVLGFVFLLAFHLFWAREALSGISPYGNISFVFIVSVFIFGIADCHFLHIKAFAFIFTVYALSRALVFRDVKEPELVPAFE